MAFNLSKTFDCQTSNGTIFGEYIISGSPLNISTSSVVQVTHIPIRFGIRQTRQQVVKIKIKMQ